MKKIYIFLTFAINYFLYLYLFLRLLKKKESPTRYKEKLCISSQYKTHKFLMWFHCSSIGELKSIFPIIDHYLNLKKNTQILVTTSTLGSNDVFQKKYNNVANIIHQFSPFDTPQIINKFFSKWRPNIIFFTESEIWPNQIFKARESNIPIILLNARLSKKSFNRWKFFKTNMKNIMSCFNLVLCQSEESQNYFNYFKTSNIQFIGNIKLTPSDEYNSKDFSNPILSKKIIFIALSTHNGEEEICLNSHINLKKKYPNLLTIIIPRHINRVLEIRALTEKLKLNFLITDSISNFKEDTDIVIVNSYGSAQEFLKLSKHVFIGGSLINHGGQNPIEVAYNNSIIFYGPYIYNFTEIYNYLNKENAAFKINSESELTNQLDEKFNNYKNINIKDKITKMGNEIFLTTIKELDKYTIN
jgi:3-deoxy-D-manno-octulosonic-acid transferase